jgi:large subunit ribosomal protein L25
MTMETTRFETQQRTTFRKKLRALRRSGVTPLHLYGRGIQPMSLQAETRRLERLVTLIGSNTPVYVSVTGDPDTHFAFIREVQRHYLSGKIVHVDSYEVSMTERLEAEVPVRLVGEAPAVRVMQGMLLQVMQAITVECLPLDIPQYVEVDVSGLTDFEKSVTVKDIRLSEKVKLLTPLGELVARVTPPRVERVEEEEEAAVAPTAAEPEVVTARKAAEGEEEEA